MRRIRVHDFDGGIAELEEAQRILPHPNTVFNIAKANEDAGRRDEAARWYRAYLATDPSDRAAVEGTLRRLEQN
jgi:iron complex outermembrane receptor protein